MKIEIDIDNKHAHLLGKWASIARTLKESESLLNALAALDIEQDLQERLFANLEELKLIIQPIDHLHQTARTAIWKSK